MHAAGTAQDSPVASGSTRVPGGRETMLSFLAPETRNHAQVPVLPLSNETHTWRQGSGRPTATPRFSHSPSAPPAPAAGFWAAVRQFQTGIPPSTSHLTGLENPLTSLIFETKRELHDGSSQFLLILLRTFLGPPDAPSPMPPSPGPSQSGTRTRSHGQTDHPRAARDIPPSTCSRGWG